MKKFFKSLAFILMIPLALTKLGGCGDKTVVNEPKESKVIYVPTERTLLTETDSRSSDYVLIDGRLNYIIQKMDKDYYLKGLVHHSELPDGSDPKDTELELDINPDEYVSNVIYEDSGLTAMFVTYKETGSICRMVSYDNNGKITSDTMLEDNKDSSENNYVCKILKDNEGTYCLATYSGLYRYDMNGKLIGKIVFEKDSFYLSSCFSDSHGDIYVLGFDTKKGTTRGMKADFNSGKLTEVWKGIPDEAQNMFEMSDGNYLVFTYDELYTYSVKDDTSTELLKFINADLVNVYPEAAWKNDDNTLSFVSMDYAQEKIDVLLITLKEETEVDQSSKKTLTLGVMYADDQIKRTVAKYNRSNGNYRIEIKEYESSVNWEQSREDFLSDVASGAVDIVKTSDLTDVNPENFADLNPYIDKDGTDRSKYFEELFKACEYKGKLYTLPTSFAVKGYIGNSDYVGTGGSWTFDEFVEFVKNNPDKQIFMYCTATDFLCKCINEMGSSLIDYDNATCDLDSDKFKTLMELAKRYPEKFKDSDYTGDEFTLLQKGEIVLFDYTLSDTMFLQAYTQIMGDKFNPIGIPGETGSSFKYVVSDSYAILENCKDKDGAWEFLRTFLEDDFQSSSDMWSGFPVSKVYFEKKLDAAQNNTFGGGSIMADDMTIEVGPPSEEDFAIIKGIIDKADSSVRTDDNIYSIIEEEYSAYYNGKKTVDEVAEVIQSRVSIYLAERYG